MVLGKTISEIYGNSAKSKAYLDIERQVLETGRAQIDEDTFTFDDGIERRISVNRFPIFDDGGVVAGVGTFLNDITEQHGARRQAAAATQQLLDFVENSPATIVFKDLENRYVRVNKAFCDWTGMTEAELVGKTTAEIYGPANAHLLEDMNRRVVETREVVEGEHWISFPNGTRRYVSMTRFPLFDESGAVLSGRGDQCRHYGGKGSAIPD